MRFLQFRQLKSEKGIPYSRMHLGRLEKVGKFPKRVKIGPNAVGWIEDEIDAHQATLAIARNGSPVA